jgi:ribonuclease HII
VVVLPTRHPGYTPRSVAGLTGYERVLARAGLSPVAGIDEAGRGACAGPLVVAAVAFEARRLAGLHGIADSKALTAKARERAYDQVVATALAWHIVVIPSTEIDQLGLHVCNIAGMRRALAGLPCQPAYVLTDGFAVRGLGVPALAMWKGDEVAACVAAASVLAKVTRDRLMRDLHQRYPLYGFARHKGYSTPGHMRALRAHGPCPEHRQSFVNVGCVSATACGAPEVADGVLGDAGGVPEDADDVPVAAGGVLGDADGVLGDADSMPVAAGGVPGDAGSLTCADLGAPVGRGDPAQHGAWIGAGRGTACDDRDAEAAWSDRGERTAWSDPGLEN